MYSYLREDLTAVASRAAHTITDRSSHDRAVDKSINEAATSQSQPFKKSISDADDSVVQHPGNRDEKVTSNSQQFNKPTNEDDLSTVQQPSVVDGKADPNNQPLDAEDSVVQHSGNRDENATSNSQHSIKPANEDDFPTAQQPSVVDDKAVPNNQPLEVQSRRPLTEEEKRYTQHLFRETVNLS